MTADRLQGRETWGDSDDFGGLGNVRCQFATVVASNKQTRRNGEFSRHADKQKCVFFGVSTTFFSSLAYS